MKKRLLSLVVASFVVTPLLSFGAGLGSVRTYSNLNERLRAEIPVLSVKKRGQMSVALAPDTLFSQRGITRSKDVRNLRFSLIKKGQRYYVKVSSIKPVSTPYLNFILELKDGEGKTHREYAVFLDPVSPNSKKSKTSSATSRKQNSRTDKKVATRKEVTKHSAKSKTKHIATPTVAGEVGSYGPVKRGETLSGVALKVRPSKDISIRQMIRLLQEANPKLKYGLKADSILNVPTIKGYPPYQGGTGKATSLSVEIGEKGKVTRELVKVKPITEKQNEIAKPIVKEKTISRVVSSIHDSVGADSTTQPVKTVAKPSVEKDIGQSIKPVSQPLEGIKVTALGDEKGKASVEVKPETQKATSKIISSINSESTKTTAEPVAQTKPVETKVVKTIAKPVESTEKPIAKPVSQPTSKPISAVKKPVVNTDTESDEGGFSWLLWLGGGIIALLGVLGLGFFAWKKRKASSEERVVLLGDDDDEIFDETLDDALSVTEHTETKEIVEQTITGNSEKESAETDETILKALEKDIELEKTIEKDFEDLLSSADNDDASLDDNPFDDELFNLDNAEDENIDETASVLSRKDVAEVSEPVEVLENASDDEGLVFDLENYSEEDEKEHNELSEEQPESFEHHNETLDFNLDEPLEVEVQEESDVQTDEKLTDDATISDEDNGLTFEVNDNVADELVEHTSVDEEVGLEANTIDFNVDDISVATNNEADEDNAENFVTDNHIVDDVADTGSDKNEHITVKEKTLINEPKPFTVDKVAGKNIDLSSFSSLNGTASKPVTEEVKKAPAPVMEEESVVAEQISVKEETSIKEEAIEKEEKAPVLVEETIAKKTIAEKVIEVEKDTVQETIDVPHKSDNSTIDTAVTSIEKATDSAIEVVAHKPKPKPKPATDASIVEAVIVSEKTTDSSSSDRYSERYKARRLEMSKRITDSNDDITKSKVTANNSSVAKSYRHTEIEMKMAMAETFISVSNYDRAKELLQYIIQEGSDAQIDKAKSILREIG